MAHAFTVLGIVRYADSLGRAGKLKGVITFTDGKSLKVWQAKPGDPDLHAQCRQLAAFPPHAVRYQFRHSEKWGDALTMIESSKTDYELASLAREVDEQRGRVKPNSYEGRMLAQRVESRDPDPAKTVGDDHESLMRREG